MKSLLFAVLATSFATFVNSQGNYRSTVAAGEAEKKKLKLNEKIF